MLINILRHLSCSWFRNSQWSRAAEMMSDGLVWFACFLFPFPPMFGSVRMSGLLLLECRTRCNCFCHCLAALLCYWETVILKLPKIQVMPRRQMKCFHSSCPCSALTCPLEIGISSLKITSMHFLPRVQRKEWNLFHLMSIVLLCIQDKIWSDLCLKTMAVCQPQSWAACVVCCAGHVALTAWFWSLLWIYSCFILTSYKQLLVVLRVQSGNAFWSHTNKINNWQTTELQCVFLLQRQRKLFWRHRFWLEGEGKVFSIVDWKEEFI